MKLKDGIMITEVGGEKVLVDAGVSGECFRGIIRLNDTAAFISEMLIDGATEDEIVSAITAEYEGVPAEQLKDDVEKFIAQLDDVKLIEQ